MEKKVFEEISKKCIEKLNEYFDTCCDELGDRYDLNDKIMEVGASYGITLFDLIWLLGMPASMKINPGLEFAISLPLTSTGAANNDDNYILIKVFKKGAPVARIEIDEDGVNISGLDSAVEEIVKI